MLVISRREGESVVLAGPDGTRIFVHVVRHRSGRYALGIEAPDDVLVLRGELYREKLRDGSLADPAPAPRKEA